MKLETTGIEGVFIIEHDVHTDQRGEFVKTFQKEKFAEVGLDSDFSEAYYTYSKKNVIRGMHFQQTPYEHAKLVSVIDGAVTDVVLDLRRWSPTQGQHIAIELSGVNRKSVYIPRGCAHGFRVVREFAIVYYLVTSEYSPLHDKGIRFDSIGYDWQVRDPILSDRDLQFPNLADFQDFFA
jgi:dTDP-4-dehydrorhamnose 3,5-epimerase